MNKKSKIIIYNLQILTRIRYNILYRKRITHTVNWPEELLIIIYYIFNVK